MSNPFKKLIEAIREEGRFYNEPSFFVGKIKSPLHNLEVLWGNQTIVKEKILIDKALLDRHNYSVECSEGSITHNLKDTLSIGDEVVMFINDNKFIIISKVVSV